MEKKTEVHNDDVVISWMNVFNYIRMPLLAYCVLFFAVRSLELDFLWLAVVLLAAGIIILMFPVYLNLKFRWQWHSLRIMNTPLAKMPDGPYTGSYEKYERQLPEWKSTFDELTSHEHFERSAER